MRFDKLTAVGAAHMNAVLSLPKRVTGDMRILPDNAKQVVPHLAGDRSKLRLCTTGKHHAQIVHGTCVALEVWANAASDQSREP